MFSMKAVPYHRQQVQYNDFIDDVEFIVPRQHEDLLSELESVMEVPVNSSQKEENVDESQTKKNQKVMKEEKSKTKNFFTNIGTYLHKYMHKKCNPREIILFQAIFGRKKQYKNMTKYSNLFASPLQKYCIQFFTTEILKYFIKSNTTDKSQLIKFLPRLRQGAIKGQIKILKYKIFQ